MLAGVRRLDLTGLNPDDARRLFQAQGVQATRAEVVAVGEPLAYHPLSLRLLAGYAARDPNKPLDLQAAAGYDPTADLLGKRQHILSQAYDSLPPTARDTLSRLAAFRGSVIWETTAAVLGDSPPTRDALLLLENRGLLQRTTQRTPQAAPVTSYDLHPIVRRYAYARLSDPAGVHAQLVSHFEAVPKVAKVQTIADLLPAIELYHHLARAGKYDEAVILFRDRLESPLYFQLGAYQQHIELLRVLFPEGEDKLPRLSQERDQAWTLNSLANSYSLSGRPAAAAPLFERQIAIREKQGDKKNLATGLGNLANMAQLPLGQLAAAATNLRRSIALCQEIEDKEQEALGHYQLGRVLSYSGQYNEAEAEFALAMRMKKETRHIQAQGIVWAYRALAALLQGDAAAGQAAGQEALRLAEEFARTRYPVERDFVRAYWLLGWAALAGGALAQAQTHLDEALRRCRAINIIEHEPAILLAQARLAQAAAQRPPTPGSADPHTLAQL